MTSTAVVLAPVVMAVILIVSGIAKYRDPDATASSIRLLRLPSWLQKPWVTRALPIGELVLAVLMLIVPAGPLSVALAVSALILFVVYLAVIARAMGFNPRPSCGCFGRIGDQTVRARTVVRNAFFVGLALLWLVATLNGRSVPGLLSALPSAGWAWLIGAVVAAVATYFVVGGASKPLGDPNRQQMGHEVRHSVHQEPAPATPSSEQESDEEWDYVRVPTPNALLIDHECTPHLLYELTRQKAALLVFANCYCGPTYAAWEALKQARPRLPQIDAHMVFSTVRPPDSTDGQPEPHALWDPGSITWDALQITGSPAAVLLGADGMLAGGPVHGVEEINEFVRDIEEALTEQPVVGEVVAVVTEPGHPI